MDNVRWNNSSLKKNWFPNEKSLPENAVEEISRQALALYQQTAAVVRTLSHPFWHGHPVRSDGVLSVHCPTCHTLIPLLRHLPPLFANVEDVVIAFFDEPEHHRELEQAVRLYSFSLLLVLSGHIERSEQDLLEYAQYRLEELHGLSLLQKGLEGEKDDHFVTSEHEMHFLVKTFIEVYMSLREELDAWQTTHPHLSRLAFPAMLGPALLHKQTAHEWPVSPVNECVVSLPLYEWNLLRLLLEESAVHASFCSSLKEALADTPQWIPGKQQCIDEWAVTQPRLIWQGLVTILLRISEHLDGHGCDDVPFSQWVPDLELRRALMKRYHDFNGDPEVFEEDQKQGVTYEIYHFGVLVWYIARRITTQVSNLIIKRV